MLTEPNGDTAVGATLGAYRDETLLERFRALFRTVPANSPPLLSRAQEIRYQVYCVENAFEDPAKHPLGLERDEFDHHAVHSLLLVHGAEAVGTVRLVLPRAEALDRSFALQHLINPRLGSLPFPIHSSAEVSRFSISKDYLRRGICDSQEAAPRLALDPRHAPLMRLGLIQSLVRMSREHGISHWCAVMEPKLLRMLAAMGIHFQPIGPLVDYHGQRQPCYCELNAVLHRVKRERPAFWEVLTDGGAIEDSYRAAA